MSIEVKNLTKFYGEQAAVHDFSFTINKGEIVGFWVQMELEDPQL